MPTPHEQAQHGVAELVRGLPVPTGAEALNVYERLTTNGINVVYPLALVTIAGLIERKERIAFGTWKWTYPVLVLFADRGAPQDPNQQPPYAAWRDILEESLETATSLTGVDGFHDVSCEPGGNVTGIARGRTEPGQTADPLGPAWLKVAGAMTVQVEVIREG